MKRMVTIQDAKAIAEEIEQIVYFWATHSKGKGEIWN